MVEEKHEGGGIRPPPGKIGSINFIFLDDSKVSPEDPKLSR